MTKDHQSRHDRRRERGAAHPSPDTVIMVAGIVTTTPPQLLNPMPSDTLRIGVPIMRPGFITATGLLPPSGGGSSRVWLSP